MTVLEAAKKLVQVGVSVVPLQENKRPCTDGWKEFQLHIPSIDSLDTMFRGAVGIGAICGAVSGCLECIDFDEEGAYDLWRETLVESGYGELVQRLTVQSTPKGFGRHVVYRCLDGVEGNKQLAWSLNEHAQNGRNIRIETRGEGGYFQVWPSPGYAKVQGTWGTIPSISAEERDALFSAARMQNEWVSRPYTHKGPEDIKRPGDEFAEKVSWAEILEPAGWSHSHHRGGEDFWVRPGKTKREGAGATTNYRGSDMMKVFTSNAWPFEPDATYTKFCAYATIHCRGDMMAAAKLLAEQGYGDKIRPTKRPTAAYNAPQAVSDAPERAKQRWVTMEDIPEKEVTWLWKHYIGIGEVQMIVGDPGDGKSTVAQALVTAVSRGANLFGDDIPQGKSIFLSAEQSVNSITKPRFRQMGADMREIICPDEVDENDDPVPFVLDKSGIAELREICLELRPKLVVIDTVTAYIEASRDFNSANQVREWMRRLAEIARITPCAVVLIGHLNKNQNAHPLQRVMGSMDFVGASRAVLLVGKDPDEPDTRGLCVIKSNLGPFGDPRGFRLERTEGDECSFSWTDGTTLDSTKMLHPPAIKAAETNHERCVAWIKGMFKDTTVVEAPKEENGKIGPFTTYMVTKVKKELGVASRKDGMADGGWVWMLGGDDNVYRGGD